MAALRKMKALIVLFALVVMCLGAFTIMSAEKATASYACCMWVMYCTVDPPIVCWDVCIPVPCP